MNSCCVWGILGLLRRIFCLFLYKSDDYLFLLFLYTSKILNTEFEAWVSVQNTPLCEEVEISKWI